MLDPHLFVSHDRPIIRDSLSGVITDPGLAASMHARPVEHRDKSPASRDRRRYVTDPASGSTTIGSSIRFAIA